MCITTILTPTGDTEKTESETVDACEKTFKELGEVVKKLASGNVHNMIITADHGFLYQDRDLDGTEWLSEQPRRCGMGEKEAILHRIQSRSGSRVRDIQRHTDRNGRSSE